MKTIESKNPTQRLSPLAAIVAGIALAAMPVHAGILFTEDFETPDITGYAQGTRPTGWVSAAQGQRLQRRLSH